MQKNPDVIALREEDAYAAKNNRRYEGYRLRDAKEAFRCYRQSAETVSAETMRQFRYLL